MRGMEVKKLNKFSLNEWKVLSLLYEPDYWWTNSYSIQDIQDKTNLKKNQVRYVMARLLNLNLVKSINSFLIFYKPIKNQKIKDYVNLKSKKNAIVGDYDDV